MLDLPERYTVTTDGQSFEELLDLLDPPSWHRDTACKEHPEVNSFSTSKGPSATLAAEAVCASCLARDACLDAALADPLTDGVWGGMTPKERRRIRAAKAA